MGQEAENGVRGELGTGVVKDLHETNQRSIRQRSSRGKSSKEMKKMIAILKQDIQQLKFKLKLRASDLREKRKVIHRSYTKEELKEVTKEVNRIKQQKVLAARRSIDVRDRRIANLQQKIKELQRTIILKDREIKKSLERADRLKDSYNKARGSARRKKKIKVYAQLTVEQQRYKNILERGIDISSYNTYVHSVKICNFSKQSGYSVELLAVLQQIEAEGSVIVKRLSCGSRVTLNKGVELELLSVQNVQATKHYFLTIKGKEVVMSLKKAIKRRSDVKF